MNWNNKYTVFIMLELGLLLALALVQGCSLRAYSDNRPVNFVDAPPTPVIDREVNRQFLETNHLDSSYEVNGGLRLERIEAVAMEGIPTPAANYVALLILNHTEEPINFDDIGFGIQICQYEPASSQWNKVVLPYVPEKKSITLPPKTEGFNSKVLNSWEFNDRDFVNVDSNVIRIFIRGLGENSNKHYAAFIDLTLQK